MKKEHLLQYFLAAALMVSLLYAGLSQAEPLSPLGLGQGEPFGANIGFGSTIKDDEILNLLQRHGVAPRAVFMWTAGFTGAHRTYEAKSVQDFLRDARAKTVETFEKSLQGNLIRLRRFVKMHTEKEVVADSNLQTRARSLLNLRAAFEAGLVAARNSEPLILSMEVSGDAAQIGSLGKDEMVKVFEPAVERDGKVVVPHTPKPEAYQGDYLDPDVQAMSAQEVYQRIIEILAAADAQEGK